MFDHTKVKLGKRAPKIDPRTLRLAKYLSPSTLPAPAASVNWYKGVTSFGEMLNSTLGDCTCAAIGHAVQVATLNNQYIGEITPTDALILSLYEKSCGYNPRDPNSDQGGVIVDVLNYVRQNPPWQHNQHRRHPLELYAYADPDSRDINHVKLAIQWFATVNIGLQLPVTAQAQTGNGGTWDVVGNVWNDANSQPGSWGGHSVIVSAYDDVGPTCITWGMLQKMTWKFFLAYTDESHALLFRAFAQQYEASLGGALGKMLADLAAIAN
jgi:hypothetical protein